MHRETAIPFSKRYGHVVDAALLHKSDEKMHKKFKNKNYPHKKKDKASISMAKHNLGAGDWSSGALFLSYFFF